MPRFVGESSWMGSTGPSSDGRGEWRAVQQDDHGEGGGGASAGSTDSFGHPQPSACVLQGLVTCVQRCVMLTSLADKLSAHYPVLGLLIGNPQSTALLVLGAYGVLLFIWFPLYVLSLAISTPGVYLLVFGVLYLAGRLLARTLSYPGNVPTVLRDIEVEYAAQMVRKLDHCSVKLKEWVADLRVVVNTTIPTLHPLLSRHHLEVCFLRKHMLGVFVEALRSVMGGGDHRLTKELRLSESAVRDARQLLSAVERVVSAIDAAMPVAQRVLAIQAHGSSSGPGHYRHLGLSGGGLDGSHGAAAASLLQHHYHGPSPSSAQSVAALEAVVEAADQLKRVAPLFRRDRPSDEVGCLGVVKHWLRARRPWDNVLGSYLMREELCKRMQARQLWVEMEDGAKLDCCHIPAQRTDPATGRSMGLVLYCNPNAGHYECSTHAPFSSDWVDLYTSLGCDVLLFNYRGYGRSTGSPSPMAVMRDAEALVRHVRKELGATRIAVHGESIGGMVACHVARHCEGVELLVADRTFSTLSAVADRLMFSWAGAALHFFTGWPEADVVSDYVSAPCYKLVCSDPNDAIISEAASLKVGVAVRLELGDRRHKRVVVPEAYLLAEALDASPSASAKVPHLPSSPHERLSEEALMHFAACLRFLARRAKAHDLRDARSSGGRSGGLAQELAGRLAQGQAGFDGDDSDAEGGSEDDDEEGSSFSSSAASSPAWTSPSLGTLQQLWRTLARCDGLCGRMLGQAVAKDVEAVRAWVCCLVQWGPGQSLLLSSGAVRAREGQASLTIQVVRLALEEVWERRGPELKSLVAEEAQDVEFVMRMVAYLDDRLTHDTQRLATRQGGSSGSTGERCSSSSSSHKAAAASSLHGPSPPLSRAPASMARPACGAPCSCGGGSGGACDDEVEAGLLGSSREQQQQAVGELLSLQCGHNASFSELERERLLYHLSAQGWVVEAAASPPSSL